jgi:glucokinase
MNKLASPSLRSIPTRPSDLRQANARGLLKLLRAHNPCSKADLVRYSGLSAPTVSSGIGRLEELELVQRMGDGKSNGGRPPGMLRFNSTYGYVAAVDIGGTRLRMMLTDLDGTVLSRWSVLLGAKQKTPEGVCRLVAEALETLCEQSQAPIKKVLHLVAGAPGITNMTEGVILTAPNLELWEDVPLRALLEEQTGIACTVENDTNLAALGEHWRGVAQGVDNFVFIALGTGIGAGIFVGGQLCHGAHWSAGEIGYFGVNGRERGPIRTHKTGQLEQIIGGGGIQEEWLRILRESDMPVESELASLKATQIFDLAREGDSRAIELIHSVAQTLANSITDISLLLNPDMVVLGGGVGAHPNLCQETDKLLQRQEFARPVLRSSGLGTEAQLYGAVAAGLKQAEKQFRP